MIRYAAAVALALVPAPLAVASSDASLDVALLPIAWAEVSGRSMPGAVEYDVRLSDVEARAWGQRAVLDATMHERWVFPDGVEGVEGGSRVPMTFVYVRAGSGWRLVDVITYGKA